MDINVFEIAGKTARRAFEAVEDTYNAVQENFTQEILHGLICKPGTYSHGQASRISQAAREALEHEDIEEAEHQLHRELYFSSIFPVEAGSVDEQLARVGLKAIKENKTAKQVQDSMDDELLPASLRSMHIRI